MDVNKIKSRVKTINIAKKIVQYDVAMKVHELQNCLEREKLNNINLKKAEEKILDFESYEVKHHIVNNSSYDSSLNNSYHEFLRLAVDRISRKANNDANILDKIKYEAEMLFNVNNEMDKKLKSAQKDFRASCEIND